MDNREALEAAAHLLVSIAGPAPQHIEMSARGPKKYYSVPRQLALDDARLHLCGVSTLGALCSYPDGSTRALAYDADSAEAWQRLQAATRALAAAGYQPLLEPSPAGRGGHIWIIFTDLVDAQAAHMHAHQIASELAGVKEYWPGPPNVAGWNRIRLPGGRYISPEMRVWCHLYDATGRELARHGPSAVRVLLQEQTPASLIPALPSAIVEHNAAADVIAQLEARTDNTLPSIPPVPGPDPAMLPKRNTPTLRNQGNRFLWFAFSADQIVTWFNERHSLEELHPTEKKNGMAFSPSVSERTPSTSYHDTAAGERWTDFSSQARRADGHPDGGDALELYVRLHGGSKAQVLREVAREMIAKARTDLEAAARSGAKPPVWVQDLLTEAGWEHYRKLACASGHVQDEDRA